MVLGLVTVARRQSDELHLPCVAGAAAMLHRRGCATRDDQVWQKSHERQRLQAQIVHTFHRHRALHLLREGTLGGQDAAVVSLKPQDGVQLGPGAWQGIEGRVVPPRIFCRERVWQCGNPRCQQLRQSRCRGLHTSSYIKSTGTSNRAPKMSADLVGKQAFKQAHGRSE